MVVAIVVPVIVAVPIPVVPPFAPVRIVPGAIVGIALFPLLVQFRLGFFGLAATSTVLADLLAIMLFRISTRPRQRVRLSSLAYAFGEADNTMVPQIARPATRLLSFRDSFGLLLAYLDLDFRLRIGSARLL